MPRSKTALASKILHAEQNIEQKISIQVISIGNVYVDPISISHAKYALLSLTHC
ncbi:MAG: hypothetical protein Q6363_006485 [Candidatus Njordarchaeota archaeon]